MLQRYVFTEFLGTSGHGYLSGVGGGRDAGVGCGYENGFSDDDSDECDEITGDGGGGTEL